MNTKIELVNFRDLGGIPAADGKKVAPFRLLRSAEPNVLSDSDKCILHETYDLRTIVDLRTATERSKQPDDTLPNVENVFIDVMKNAESSVPNPENFLSKLKKPSDTQTFMENAYGMMIKDPTAQAGFKEVISIFLRQKFGSTLYHCTTGKDRTGIASAIILTILGASREDIMEDYLKTNIMRKADNERVLKELKEKGIDDGQLEAISLALGVQESYLGRSFETAEKIFGSFEGYISEGLGVTPEMTGKLREMYLV